MFRVRFALMFVACAAVILVGSSRVLAGDEAKSATVSRAAVEPALGGYSPASYLLDLKAVKGDPKFQSTFRGEVYYHATAELKESFNQDPVRFLPELGGLCTTALGGPYGNRFASDPRVFAIENERLYMFSSTRAMRAYLRDPGYYIDRALQRFGVPEFNGYCPVSYVRDGKPAKGKVSHLAVYRTNVYLFADADALKLFDQDPGKYIPQYGGHCPMSMAKTKKVQGDPLVFSVLAAKVFLFENESARNHFNKGSSEIIEKADFAWDLYQQKPQ